jgi:multiple sugar transport system permease protein
MKKFSREAVLVLLAIPILLWSLLPIYHIFLFAISSKDSAFSGALWPDQPTLRNFGTIAQQHHFYLHHFWVQIWNSLWIAVAAGVITLFVATCAAFAISRLKVKGGRAVMNLALFTYFIPAAFLAIPMYKAMGAYGLLNSRWSLVLAMVTLAAPYAIWVLKQASDKLPFELDEAARIDGATPTQRFWHILWPQLLPTIAVLCVLRFIWTFNNFDDIYLLTGGGAGTEVVAVRVFDYMTARGDIGAAAAQALVLAAILAVLVGVYLKLFGRQEEQA